MRICNKENQQLQAQGKKWKKSHPKRKKKTQEEVVVHKPGEKSSYTSENEGDKAFDEPATEN